MPTIKKRGQSYQLNWTDIAGRHRKSLGNISKSQAKQILEAKQIELLTGSNPLVITPILNDFSTDYLKWYAQHYPASHNRSYQIIKQHILPTFGTHNINQIKPVEVEAWKSERLSEQIKIVRGKEKTVRAKTATVEKELRVFKAMLNQAVKWEVIDKHPFKQVTAPPNIDSKPPRFYTIEEMQRIYKAAPNHKWIWQLMVNTGLRRGEALQLTDEHINNKHINVISINGARTKSGKWRSVPLNSAALLALNELNDDGHVLPKTNPVSLSRAFTNTLNRANLDGSLHCLRHTFCSHLIMSGVSLRTVQVLAGHAHFSTTEKYAHLAPDHLIDSVKSLKL